MIAKRPEPGRTKTRLCPPLSPQQAAAFAEAFLKDTISACQRAGCAETLISYAPNEALDWFTEQWQGVGLLPQRGADLGERLVNLFKDAWERRYQPFVGMGADSPDLPSEYLCAAFDALKPGKDSADVVLGPSTDGGYYLIGMKWATPELFRDIPWSTDKTFERTLERVEAMKLKVHLLPVWSDVDTPEDLIALQQRLEIAQPDICLETRKLLENETIATLLRQTHTVHPPVV